MSESICSCPADGDGVDFACPFHGFEAMHKRALRAEYDLSKQKARLTASEAREAAMLKALTDIKEGQYPMGLIIGQDYVGIKHWLQERAKKGLTDAALAQPGAAPSVPREELWLCGCGAQNGVNLATCGVCNRSRNDGEVLARVTKKAVDVFHQQAIAFLRTEHERVKAELVRMQKQHDVIQTQIRLPDSVPISYMELAHENATLRADLEQRTKERDALLEHDEIHQAFRGQLIQERDEARAQLELEHQSFHIERSLSRELGERNATLRQRVNELEQAIGWYAEHWQGMFGERARAALAATAPDAQSGATPSPTQRQN